VHAVAQVFGFPNPVNDVSARGVAAGTAVLGLLCLVFRQPWLMAVLAVEFLLRVASGPRFEPLALLVTRVVTPALPFEERPTPGPPKRFAQSIGAVVTLLATALYYGAGLAVPAYGLIVLLVAFALLESVFGICVGCKAFAVLMRLGVIPSSVCEECQDLGLRWKRLGVEVDGRPLP
jgi:Domain of unknown function (DUF4395)